MARTAKKKISVLNGGIEIASDMDSLNFTGSQLATAIGFNITDEATGGGAGSSYEKSSTIPDSATKIFAFTHLPIAIIVNGTVYFPTEDYTVSGSAGSYSATFISLTPQAGSTVYEQY